MHSIAQHELQQIYIYISCTDLAALSSQQEKPMHHLQQAPNDMLSRILALVLQRICPCQGTCSKTDSCVPYRPLPHHITILWIISPTLIPNPLDHPMVHREEPHLNSFVHKVRQQSRDDNVDFNHVERGCWGEGFHEHFIRSC